MSRNHLQWDCGIYCTLPASLFSLYRPWTASCYRWQGETQYSLLRYAAMAAKWKEPPRDALDTLTLNAVDMKSMEQVEQLDFMPFDPIVKRTEGTVREIATGKTFKTTKGVSRVFPRMSNLCVICK